MFKRLLSFSIASILDRLSKRRSVKVVSIEEFRKDPAAVISLTDQYGEVVVESDDPNDYMRFVTQTYDIPFD